MVLPFDKTVDYRASLVLPRWEKKQTRNWKSKCEQGSDQLPKRRQIRLKTTKDGERCQKTGKERLLSAKEQQNNDRLTAFDPGQPG